MNLPASQAGARPSSTQMGTQASLGHTVAAGGGSGGRSGALCPGPVPARAQGLAGRARAGKGRGWPGGPAHISPSGRRGCAARSVPTSLRLRAGPAGSRGGHEEAQHSPSSGARGPRPSTAPSRPCRPAPADQPAVQVQLHRRRGGEDRAGRGPHRALPEVRAAPPAPRGVPPPPAAHPGPDSVAGGSGHSRAWCRGPPSGAWPLRARGGTSPPSLIPRRGPRAAPRGLRVLGGRAVGGRRGPSFVRAAVSSRATACSRPR